MSTWSSRLREERSRLGLNQDAIAGIAGVKRNAQSRYELGERTPDVNYLSAITGAGVDVLYVITGHRSGGGVIDGAPVLVPPRHVVIQRLAEMDQHDGMREIVVPEMVLGRRTHIDTDALRWALMPTAAMQPTIERDAIVFIDITRSGQQQVADGNTYAYTLAGRPDVRRILIRSDHWSLAGPPGAGHEYRDVYGDDMTALQIHGEVVAAL